MQSAPRIAFALIGCAWALSPALAVAQTPAYAPVTREIDGVNVHVVYIRDERGIGVPYATVETDRRPEQANLNGVVVIERSPGLVYPFRLDVRAPGFHPTTVFVDQGRDRVEVSLKRDPAQTPPGGKTVSAAELSGPVREEVARLGEQARAALDRKDLAAAEALFRRMVELSPSLTKIHHALAIIALHQGRVDDAGRHLERAAELEPTAPKLTGDLGMVRFFQNRRRESYRLLTAAAERGYDRPGTHFRIGVLALGQGNWKEARRQLERSSAERSPYRDLFLTQALRSLGKTRDAAKAFVRFVARNPASLLVFHWRASTPPPATTK